MFKSAKSWSYQSGERLIYQTEISPIIWIWPILSLWVGLGCMMLTGILLLLAYIFLGLAVLLAIQNGLVSAQTRYIVTNQRILLFEYRQLTQLYLSKVDGLIVRQNRIGRWLHYGDVAWIVSGHQQPWIHYVRAPVKLRQAVDYGIAGLQIQFHYTESPNATYSRQQVN